MRNNINKSMEGNTNVKSDERVFDSTKAGFDDTNSSWNKFQTYYDENQFKSESNTNGNTKEGYEAAERGKYFVCGQMILMALNNKMSREMRSRKLETA